MQPKYPFDVFNSAYIQGVYEKYLRDPASVDQSWQDFFASTQIRQALDGSGRAYAEGHVSAEQIRDAVRAIQLIESVREHGHSIAKVDPLAAVRVGHPSLEPGFHGLSEDALSGLKAEALGIEGRGESAEEIVATLKKSYCGTIGYEFAHIGDARKTAWLKEQVELGVYGQAIARDEKRGLLQRLTAVEGFEQFLHKAYQGVKRFSIEGTDMLVPMLDEAIAEAAKRGTTHVVIGMAHRGRLNVLTHVLRKPYQVMLQEFEGKHTHVGETGDVKYHMGWASRQVTPSGHEVEVTLAPNPSHLEFVNPVVAGMARALQTTRGAQVIQDANKALAIQVHGDAAFIGQGVVAETLNMAKLRGYDVGGTLHVIANNQVGFTTNPSDSRSTEYASDLAKAFGVPVLHVNADDPEACIQAVRLAIAYRSEFGSDVVIDLIGYRRWGHNEGDEPTYTQPTLYAKIRNHPTVRQIFAERLEMEGVVSGSEAKAMWDAVLQVMEQAQAVAKEWEPQDHDEVKRSEKEGVETAVQSDKLLEINGQLFQWPSGLAVSTKLEKQLQRRAKTFEEGQPIEWGHAEALAYASLVTEGIPVRITGQDVERGTFSQRQLVLHDSRSDECYAPIQNLSGATASIEIHNSPLSEAAVVGFEYGYSVSASEALVLWEAQFGDFANGAQVLIDQFIASGEAKWEQSSGLVLLLPHGYEGQGPEHSSARIERFLQLAANGSLRIANCTSAAQYFHLLRKQARSSEKKPLVIFTPKSLLRHPRAASLPVELSEGSFQPVIADCFAAKKADVRRILFCSGKVIVDLMAKQEEANVSDVAILRMEQIHPFPAAEVDAVLQEFKGVKKVVWVQEEPENMGAWRYVAPHLDELLPLSVTLDYVGRGIQASPAEGYAKMHSTEQTRIVEEALGLR